ncbi:MAG: cyclase family protein [Thermomicrobiaceae bacterium]
MNSRYFDISVSLRPDLPVWPSDPAISLESASRTASGDTANVTRVGIGTHTGTHVDAEWHFIDDGRTLEALTPDRLIGPCYVVDLTAATDHITASDLESADIPDDTVRLLLKTTNSNLWVTSPSQFDTGYLGIAPDGAEWLVARGIDLVGIDYHSVEPYSAGGTTHRIMLGSGQIILETLNLGAVNPGSYTLYCLPLRIDGYDGAPCRAVLGTD